jgi:hypoxanthine phosphoribosyltransferase
MAALPILFTREQIETRVAQLAAEITRDFAGEPLLLVGVLKGAAVFLSDLSRAIELDTSFDFISVASYKAGMTSSGEVRLQKDLDESIEGRNVLLVEDILDTGLTLTYICGLLRARNPKALKVIALLDKPSRRSKPFKADYVGFEVANQFVVGYGMDHAERYRNLPDVRFLPSA